MQQEVYLMLFQPFCSDNLKYGLIKMECIFQGCELTVYL